MYKDVTYNSNNIKGDGTVQEQSLYMLLKLGWYEFKLDCYKFKMLSIIPMVTTKKVFFK